jgi:hypothetical protein
MVEALLAIGALAVLVNQFTKKDEETNADSLYNNNNVSKITKKFNNIADDRFNRSMDAEKTKIIPPSYNMIEYFNDNASVSSEASNRSGIEDPNFLLNHENDLRNNRQYEQRINDQFSDLRFTNSNDNSLPSGTIPKVPFYSEPMFRGGDYGQLRFQHGGQVNQRDMETYTGVDNRDDYMHRKEVEPFFSPLLGVTKLNGMAVNTDFYETRYIPARERRNEKPFQPQKITPGLNLKPNEVSKYGYHDPVRPVERTTNEIRTANKPKLSYGQPVINQGSRVGRPAETVGDLRKKLPLRYKEYSLENWPSRKGGNIHAQAVYGEYDPRNMATFNRGVERKEMFGPAGGERGKIGERNEHQVPSKRENFMYDRAGQQVGLSSGGKVQAFDYKNDIPQGTTRTVINEYTHPGGGFGGTTHGKVNVLDLNDLPKDTIRTVINEYTRAGGQIAGVDHGKLYALDPEDKPEFTLRSLVNKYTHPGGGFGGTTHGKVNILDPNDVPKDTLRALINEYTRAGGQIVGVDHGKLYALDPEDKPEFTLRSLVNKYTHPGGGFGGTTHGKVNIFDPTDLPKDTIRSLIDEYTRAGGQIVGGEHGKLYALDPKDKPEFTLRSLVNHYNHPASGFGGTTHGKVRIIDFNDLPKDTIRQILDKYDRAGSGFGGTTHGKVRVIDFDDIPEETQRALFPEYKYTGNIGPVGQGKVKISDLNDVPDITEREVHQSSRDGGLYPRQQKTYTINYDGETRGITMRETTAKRDYMGPKISDVKQTMSRLDSENMVLNDSKEVISKGRKPNKVSFNAGPTLNFTEFYFKEPLRENAREFAPNGIQSRIDHLEMDEERQPNIKWYINKRTMNTPIKDSLEGNPYVNNLVYKAVLD